MKNAARRTNASAWLWTGTEGKRLGLVLLCAARMAAALCTVVEALILKELINNAVAGVKDGFVRCSIVLGCVIAFQILMWAAAQYLTERVKATLENRFKSRLFDTLLRKDYAQVTAVHSGEWMNRLTNDAVLVASSITEIIPNALGMLTRLVGSVSVILYLIKAVSWVIIPFAAVMIVISLVLRKPLKALHKKVQESDGRLRVFLTERLTNLLIVRSFAMEEETLEQASERMQDHLSRRMKRIRFLNICNVGFNVLIHGLYVAAAVYCGHGILTGSVNYGTFAAVINLVSQLKAPIVNMSTYLPRWYSMLASAERLMEAEEFDDDIKGVKKTDEEIAAAYDKDLEGLRLSDVSFSYVRYGSSEEDIPRNVVLDGISLDIRKRSIVAITGPSGCGKSTLLKLIMCFYPLNSGERKIITTDGETELDPTWRGLFAYVPQGNQLMSGSIKDVLTFGDSTVPEAEIEKALDIACASDFISELPKGLDTVLGERGSGLSEGQIQRLALARAVLSGHPFLLLDEATSSLDEGTEKSLLQKLRTLTDRTVVIVTHRLNVLSICDMEIHMDADGVSVRDLRPGQSADVPQA